MSSRPRSCLRAVPTGNEPSTGLGLSIVKKLMHAMNADLKFDTAPAQGSRFTVTIVMPGPPFLLILRHDSRLS